MSDKPKRERKPFNETAVGKFLKEKFPKVLDIAGDLTGIELLNKASDLIEGDQMASEADKMVFFKLKSDYIVEMRELDIREREIELQTLQSAHEREVGVVTATGKSDLNQRIVLFVGLVIAAAVLYKGVFEASSISDHPIFMHILGLVEGALLLPIYNYYFGSSSGSAKKSDHLEKIMKKE